MNQHHKIINIREGQSCIEFITQHGYLSQGGYKTVPRDEPAKYLATLMIDDEDFQTYQNYINPNTFENVKGLTFKCRISVISNNIFRRQIQWIPAVQFSPESLKNILSIVKCNDHNNLAYDKAMKGV